MHGSVGFVNTVALVMNVHEQQVSATAGFEAYLQNLFRMTLDITDYMLAQGAPAKLVRKIRFKHLCTELRPMIMNTIDRRVTRQDNNYSPWRIAIKAFKTNPLLYNGFFRYKILGVLLLSVSPRFYNYFKRDLVKIGIIFKQSHGLRASVPVDSVFRGRPKRLARVFETLPALSRSPPGSRGVCLSTCLL
jgi:hypothetical protein